MDKKYFLGLDGGATKSRLVLIDDSGKILKKSTGKSLNYMNIPEKAFLENLSGLLKKIKGKNISYACFALAGVDSQKDKVQVDKLIRKIKPRFPFIIVNDTKEILPAIDSESGAAIISGTGSNYYAKNKGSDCWSGGVDYLASDEGSAFYLGQRALLSAVKSFDGRGEKTILEKMIFRYTKIKDTRELNRWIMEGGNHVSKIAGVASIVQKAADKGDRASREIISDAVNELELGAKAVIKKSKLSGRFKIALVGGVFNNKVLLAGLKRKLKKRYPKSEIILVKNPEIGAAKLAIKEFNRRNSKR